MTVKIDAYLVPSADRAPVPVFISVRRWFSPRYGNTYHSVRVQALMVSAHGRVWKEAVEPCAYGYGRAYEETAIECLRALGWPESELEDRREIFARVCLDVVDVARRGDLHHGGRQ